MKKLAALILVLTMVLSLCACGGAAPEAKKDDAPEQPQAAESAAQPEISGSGTEDDPWCVGADKPEDVTVFVTDGTLWISGSGRMRDFESVEDRPWDGIIGELTYVFVADCVEHIGARAFMGAGRDADDFDLGFFSENLLSIGESAFEGANFSFYVIVTIPESVESIGPRAFAGCPLTDIYIDGTPDIADDAFAGVTSRVSVRYGSGWDESNMLPYGGELEYIMTYPVRYVDDYGTDEITAEGTAFVPEGELFEYDAVAYLSEEDYHFVRYELISGELDIADPTDPVISSPVSGLVELKVIYEHD